MITTKSCSTCEHFPNDHHCAGCVWDEAKQEIDGEHRSPMVVDLNDVLNIINKYKVEE